MMKLIMIVKIAINKKDKNKKHNTIQHNSKVIQFEFNGIQHNARQCNPLARSAPQKPLLQLQTVFLQRMFIMAYLARRRLTSLLRFVCCRPLRCAAPAAEYLLPFQTTPSHYCSKTLASNIKHRNKSRGQ